jgi:ribosome-associated protein
MREHRLKITGTLSLPWSELHFTATRAGGPGGQHVNTSATRVELWWDLSSSPSLTEPVREHLKRRLANRLDRRGRLRLVAAASRSQHQNREAVTERFQKLVAQALQVPKVRKPTTASKTSRERRLATKLHRGRLKQTRRPPTSED